MVIKIKILSVIESVWQKILSGIGRGAGEEINNRSLYQQVCFTSLPKNGDIGIAIKDGDNISIIATVDKSDDRPVLSGNDKCAMYADKNKYIKMTTDGNIVANNGSGKILLKSNGDIELGEGVLKKLMTEAMITVYNTHTHNVSGSVTLIPNQLLSSALHATQKTDAL